VAALGIHGILPPSLLTRRWLAMLVCYLDDSGKDAQNSITTIAGFVARSEQWEAFENKVEPILNAYGVDILHTRDLHATDGCFTGWTRIKKQTFVREICDTMTPHVPLGLSMSALKDVYRRRVTESARRHVTPYAYCFQALFNWVLDDIRTGKDANTDGVAFILETGHEHNPDAERSFHAVRKKYGLENKLRSISFVGKENCRAIQMADLLAFYTRRHGLLRGKSSNPNSREPEFWTGPMMNIISLAVPVRAFVAMDFHERDQSC
jgi:Protein of unknown function (DUF3800)